ncbi:cobalamin biosynthesis protein CbiD [Candidatus Contubernalis alkalaceticus]|nr:cobalamin biosynthesis protein CbiD [Candidatus Contubernalis alkalaceticus]
MGSYQLPDGRLLRRGYTTGTCAAAAAKAALWMLMHNQQLKQVMVNTPAGIPLTLEVLDSRVTSTEASCAVKKDSGDDPDITHGVLVYAGVEYVTKPGIMLEGGEGIGKVTKRGLSLPVGASAINPAPREQIKSALQELLPPDHGVKVVISIPGGEELAKKTLNSTLGILGGLSILGSSGIVEPMSEESFKESLSLQIPVALEEGSPILVLTPGRRGWRQAVENLGFPRAQVLQMSNFVGYMLLTCTRFEVQEVLLCGSIGKLVKVAGGIFDTHSKTADGRREIMAAYAALEGASQETLTDIMEGVTAEGAAEILIDKGMKKVFNRLAEKASSRSQAYVKDKLKVGTILMNYEGEILGMDQNALEIGGNLGCQLTYLS